MVLVFLVSARSPWKALIREIEASGEFKVVDTRTSHKKVVRVSGGALCSIPGSPGDRRALLNKRAELRRLGVLA